MAPMKIISGAQTGADRGALYGALRARTAPGVGVDIGGWVPKGYLAEDGQVPEDLRPYLKETETTDYVERTRLNVRDSDMTVVLHFGHLGVGSQKTLKIALDLKKPVIVGNLNFLPHLGEEKVAWGVYADETTGWRLRETSSWRAYLIDAMWNKPSGVFNFAGPRESHAPGIQRRVEYFVSGFLPDTVTGY